MLEPKILKVSQLNSLARLILEGNFTQVLIAGEISNLVIPSSGHLYFSLKDESAQVRAVMFRYHKSLLKFQPQNGTQVVVTAKVSLYEPRGDYQLLVEWMELAGTGLLHAKFLKLKEQLEHDGLFAPERKKSLPKLPQTIGVITSPTGAVIHDILTVLKRRSPKTEVIIYPVLVQGAAAAEKIVEAIITANLRQECEVLILARGGGSLEDLWPFNEESVARAIFASTLPIISAVGHETDVTIADFVADVRAPTPSAAAELVVPDISIYFHTLQNLYQRLINSSHYKLKNLTLFLANLSQRLLHPSFHLAQQSQRLDELERRLTTASQQQLTFRQQRLIKLTRMLELVSPLATLTRGYAILSKNGHVIYQTSELALEDNVEVKITDGSLHCLIKEIIK